MRLWLFLLLFNLGNVLKAQTFQKARPYYLLKFDVNSSVAGYEKAVIRSPFAAANLSRKSLPSQIAEGKVVAIDYYYTQFKSVDQFIQVNLDSARFHNLRLQFPSIHSLIDSVPLRFIEQTLAKTVEEAKHFFHGFVIYYQLPKTRNNGRKSEVALVKKLFRNGFELDDSPDFGQLKEITGGRANDYLNIWGKMIHLSEPDTTILVSRFQIEQDIKAQQGDDFVTCYQVGAARASDQVEVKLFHVPKRQYQGTSPPPFQAGVFGLVEKELEQSRLRALSRKTQCSNELSSDLKKSLADFDKDSLVLVLDVTGSMVPSLAAVLKWIHQDKNKKKIRGVVLFNDGDGLQNEKKEMGEAGGIYFVDRIEDLQRKLIEAIQGGNGGDLPENDLEAVIAAKSHFGSGNFLLVADNIAPPRDILLLHKIDFPLSLLLCNGVEPKPHYLDLLNHSGGVLVNKK